MSLEELARLLRSLLTTTMVEGNGGPFESTPVAMSTICRLGRTFRAVSHCGREESALHGAASVLEEAREERRQIRSCVSDGIDSALRQEHRDRVKESISVIGKAIDIDANRGIETKVEDLMHRGVGLGGDVLFDAAWHELNEERLEEWLQFLEQNHFV